MRILGIDPGLRVTGFGVLEIAGQKLTYVTSGRIRTSDQGELPERIRTILEGLSQVIAELKPQQVAVEKVFVNVNPQSTLLLGQARGAAICAAVISALPVSEYTALQVKQAVVGKGHAAKEQVQEMVRRLLALAGEPRASAASALGSPAIGRRRGYPRNRSSVPFTRSKPPTNTSRGGIAWDRR